MNFEWKRWRFWLVMAGILVVANGLLLWLGKTEAMIELRGHQKGVNDIEFASTGELVATGSDDGSVRIWDLHGNLQQVLRGHSDRVPTLAFSPDSRRIVSGSGKGKILMHDVESGIEAAVLTPHDESVGNIVFNRSGETLYSVGWDSRLLIQNAATGELLREVRLPGPAESLLLLEDEGLILIGSVEGPIWTCSLSTGKNRDELIGHDSAVKGLALSGDGQVVVSCSVDRTVRFWDWKQRRELAVVACPARVFDLAFLDNDQWVVAGMGNGRLRFIRCSDHIAKADIELSLTNVRSVAVFEDQFAAGGYKALGVLCRVERLTAMVDGNAQ